MKPLAEKHFKAFIYENWLYDLSYRKMTYGVEILEGGYIRILEDPIDSNRAYLKRSIEVTFQTGPDDINPKQIEILHELLVPQIDSEGFLSYPKSWSSLPQNYESWVKSIFEDIWDCDEMKKLKLFACKMTDPNVNELYKRQLQQRAYHIVIGKLIEGGHIKEISDATYKHSVLLTHVNLMSYKISGEKLDSFIEETLWRISSRNYDEITLNTIPEFLDTIEIMEAKKPRRLKDKLTSWISDRAFDVAIADFAEEDKEIFRYIKDFVETYGNLGYLHYVDDIPDINLEILKDWLSIILQNRKSLVKDSTLSSLIDDVIWRFDLVGFENWRIRRPRIMPTNETLTSLEINNLVVFLDSSGNRIKYDSQLMAFQFNWTKLMSRADFPLKEYFEGDLASALMLLKDPISTEIVDRNTYPSRELEKYLESFENLPTGEERKNFDNAVNEYHMIVRSWSLEKIDLVTKICSPFSLNNEILRGVWFDYMKKRGYDETILDCIADFSSVRDGVNVFEQIVEDSILKQDMRNLEITITALRHEHNMVRRRLHNWIVNLIREQDEMFQPFKYSLLSNKQLYENMKFKENGKIKAYYDGADPGAEYENYPNRFNPKKHEVQMAFTTFGDYIYNGTEGYVFYSDDWTLGGYYTDVQELFGGLIMDVMHLSGTKLYKWMCGFPLINEIL